MRLLRSLLALLLLTALLPLPAAAKAAVLLDVEDPPEDVIVDPRSGSTHTGTRPSLDMLRVQQRAEENDIVLTVTFAGSVGEPNADLDVLATVSNTGGFGEQVIFGAEWDAQGKPPASVKATALVLGSMRDVNATFAVEGNDLVMRVTGLPPETPCFTAHTISMGVVLRDAEYTDWFYPPVSTCDQNDRLDGAQGACPPAAAPSGKDPVAVTQDDAKGDVRATDAFGREAGTARDEPMYDITKFESRREGDRIVQTVTFAGEPRNASRELKLEIVNRIAGDQDRDQDPEGALVVRYWRFANGSLADRIEGEHVGASDSQDDVKFAVSFDPEASTLTLSWCASLIPKDAPCFSIEVEAGVSAVFSGGLRDTARPVVDTCALAPPPGATTPPTSGEDEPTDEEAVDEEDGAGEKESPGPGALLVLAAAGLALASRRLNR